MKRLLVRLIGLLLLAVVVINGWLFLQQPKMTFFPAQRLVMTPAGWGLPYDEVVLHTEDQLELHGWYIPHPAATKTLLFFHGNSGNISHRGDSVAIFHRLGMNVFIVDYRGYGLSQGEPGESGLYLDAAAAWRYLREQKGLTAKQIIIFGRSLGGAVATQLASRVEPAALILESTFSSARDVAGHLFPRLSKILYLRYRFDSEQQISHLKSPLYMAHSRGDEVIPYALGRKLYAAAPGSKRFFEMQGGHNDGFLQSQPGYELSLKQFISELDTGVIR